MGMLRSPSWIKTRFLLCWSRVAAELSRSSEERTDITTAQTKGLGSPSWYLTPRVSRVPACLLSSSTRHVSHPHTDRRARWDFPTPRGTKSSASCTGTLSGPLHHPHTSCLQFIITGQERRKRLPYNWLTGEQKATSVVSFVFYIPA